MVELKLGNVESQFADIIWNHEPIPSGELGILELSYKSLEIAGWIRFLQRNS